MIYFDHNATTPLDERVLAAMLPYLQTQYGNPAGLYKLGRIARSAIDTAREQLAVLIDTRPEQIVFTSGGSEANALALDNAGDGKIFISAIEHPSVFVNAQAKSNQVVVLDVDASGVLLPESLAQHTIDANDFVSVMLANNETGCIQNIPQIVDRVREYGGVVHTDAVQALGKIPVSFHQLGVDLMSVSSHKIYGPKGCGALVFAREFPLHPWLRGGDQEHGFRAGTENVAAIVGFGKAAELAYQALSERNEKSLNLKIRLEQQLRALPGVVVFAEHSPRLANTVQFSIAGSKGDMLLMQLDRHHIAVSSGSACKVASGEVSPVLSAMGIPADLAMGAIRVSFGQTNTEQEVDHFVQVVKSLISMS